MALASGLIAALLVGCVGRDAQPGPGEPATPREARLQARLGDRMARERIVQAWQAQQWPQNHARWDGRVLVFRKGVGEPQRLDFSEIGAIRLRDAYDAYEHDYEVVLYGRSTGVELSPAMLKLRADRWADAAELARAASRLSGVEVISQLDRGGAPSIRGD